VNGWPLVGRDDELDRVDVAVARERGVLLAGPAGAGKTRLLKEALRRADERGDATLTVVASRASETIPLGCLSGLLATSVDVPEGAAGLVRVRHALEQIAKGRRLVLAIDDAQWLDDASAALVHQLIAGREAVVVASNEVPVQQGERGIADAADEVLEVREVSFTDRIPWLHPLQLGGDTGPECIGVFSRSPQHGFERFHAARVCSCRPARIGQIHTAALNHGDPRGPILLQRAGGGGGAGCGAGGRIGPVGAVSCGPGT